MKDYRVIWGFAVAWIAILSTSLIPASASAQRRRFFRRSAALTTNGAINSVGNSTSPRIGASPASWIQQLKPDTTEIDFGIVPRASKQEHLFAFKNTFDEPLELLDARTSCGCTKTKILTPQVAPGETAKILAKFDTLGFVGQRQATVSVVLRRSQSGHVGELQFRVKGNIRQDVVFSPAEIQFNQIGKGASAKRLANIAYAGNPDWKIVDVRSTDPHLHIQVHEVRRDPAQRRVDYEMEVQLDDQHPQGMFNEQLVVVTNDPNQSEFRVNVMGNIESSIQASPIRLGTIPQGGTISRKLIVRGNEPFRITSITASDSRLALDRPEGAKKLHIVSYRIDASEPDSIEASVHIETDLPSQPEVEIPFSATIGTPSPGSEGK